MNGPPAESVPRWFVLAVLALFTLDAAKHLWLLGAGPLQPWPDSVAYWQLGGIASTGDLWLTQSADVTRTPLYPWFLGVCRHFGGPRALWLAVLVQHLLELAVSLVTAATVFRVTGSRWAALCAYAICVLLTARCLFANTVLTETWATFLLAVLVWLLYRDLAAFHWITLISAGAVLGLSILVRPAAVAFIPALVWASWRSAPEAAPVLLRLRRVAFSLGVCAAVVLPWCIRNHLLWNRFTVTIFLGRELWTATFSPWTGANLPLPETDSGQRLKRLVEGAPLDWRHNWSVSAALSRAGLSEVETDDLMKSVAWDAIRRQPLRAATHVAARCLSFWYVKDWELDEADYPSQAPWRDQLGWSTPERRQAVRAGLRWTPERFFQPVWIGTALTWIGVIGMMGYRPYRRFGVTIALVLLGPTILTVALEIPNYRYRCLLEPTMVIAFVGGVAGALASRTRLTASTRPAE